MLTQCAWAAVRNRKSQFHRLFQRWRGVLGARKAIIAVAHRMLNVIWKLLHEGVTYGTWVVSSRRKRYAAGCWSAYKGLEHLGFRLTINQNNQSGGCYGVDFRESDLIRSKQWVFQISSKGRDPQIAEIRRPILRIESG